MKKTTTVFPTYAVVWRNCMLMKLAAAIIFACLVNTVCAQDDLRMTLDFDQTPVNKIFRDIEQRSGYKFVYANDYFPSEQPATIHLKNATVSQALRLLLNGTGFSFKLSDDLVIITALNAPHAAVVTGIVAGSDGKPLQGVTVAADNGSTQTATDAKGRFRIGTSGITALQFTSVGYISERIIPGDRRELTVTLKETAQDLNEVVMIGYGQREKRDLTGALSAIEAKDIERSQGLSPQLAMQGQMAGVNVISGGSNPTARATVRIRGVGTFSGNGAADPLYIIDGIPLVEGGAGATVDKINDPTRRGPINLYTMINPNDVESITVLKDASAAVYGVRAANGVVLITTKTGRKGKVKLDIDAVHGVQKIPSSYVVLNTAQYVKFYTDAYNAYPDLSGTTPIPIGEALNFGTRWDPASPSYIGKSATYDWQQAVRNNSSKMSNYNLRVSGLTESTSYSFSAGYSSNDGAFIGYNANRYSIAANVNSRIGKYIETGINLRGIHQNTTNPPGDEVDVNSDAWRAPPWQQIFDPAGPYGYAPLWQLNAPLTPTVFNKSSLYAQQYVAYRHLPGLIATNENINENETGLGTVYLQIQPVTALKVRGTLSAQKTNLTNTIWRAFDRWWFNENPINPYASVVNPVAGTKPGIAGISNSGTISVIKSVNVDYQKSIKDHNLNITLDASQQEYKWTGNGAMRSVVSNDPNLRYFSVTGNERGFYELRASYALVGYMARATYNYNHKYYVEGLVRRDGSSRFAPGHQWGTFPSASFGWRVSKEAFMQRLECLNDLKIRGGYGLLGNEQTTGGWSYLSVSGVVRPSYNLGNPQVINTGISFSNYPNPKLTWESLRSANVGFDALLFANKLSLTIDYYHKVTKGIIQSVELNPTTGITNPADINIAAVMNRGFEFQAAYNKTFNKVATRLSGNFTTVRNKVLALANHTALRGIGLEEGMPIGYIYGYKVGGIFQSQKEVDQWQLTQRDIISKEQKPGDIYFRDLYGPPTPGSTRRNDRVDSVIDENDQVYLGKTIPGYYYGFTATAGFKGFDFSVFFQGIGDVQKYNADRQAGENMDGFGRNQFVSVLGAWTEENHSATMPRAVYTDPNGNTRTSDRFVENAGYLRLQNVQVGYNFSEKWAERLPVIRSLRLYLTAMNLFTITKYSGLDPEDDNFPATRQYLLGIKASFQ